MGHGRTWLLCIDCRPAFRRWFIGNLPKVLERFGPRLARDDPR